MINKNAVREFVKQEEDMRVSEDFMVSLQEKVKSTVSRCMERAKGNMRNTLKERDV